MIDDAFDVGFEVGPSVGFSLPLGGELDVDSEGALDVVGLELATVGSDVGWEVDTNVKTSTMAVELKVAPPLGM